MPTVFSTHVNLSCLNRDGGGGVDLLDLLSCYIQNKYSFMCRCYESVGKKDADKNN